nr:ribonuclease H-like domain-containing protein [Tanacetum cinerariifolium]
MMQLVPVEEVYVEALQVKHLIIDWEIHTEGQRSYWKIIRLGGSTTSHQFFIDLLKHFDREDLNQLWALVKETLNIRQATSDKEKELWVELKSLYEPDVEDQLDEFPLPEDFPTTSEERFPLLRYWKKTRKKISIQSTDVAGFDKSKGSKVEESAPKALMAIDGVGWDWSYMANDEEDHALVADQEALMEFALMAKSSSDTEDMSWTRLPEFADDTITDYSRPSPSIESKSNDLQNNSTFVSENGESTSSILPKPEIKFVKATDSPTVIKTNKDETVRKPSVKYFELYRKTSKSSNVKGNISYLLDYKPYDGGYVSFGQGGCNITGKGTIKTDKLEFENVYFVKDLKYNLFSVS